MTHHNTYTTVRFGDVAREVTKSTRTPLEDGFECYIGLEHLDPESLKIRRWGLIEETATTFTRIFRAGQVLFGRRRAYQRKAALAEFDGICSGDIIVMEAKPDRLLPELLPFIVQTEGFYEHALSTSAGSLSPRTKWSALAKYEFPLPPMDEQRRIAELLWAVEDAIEAWNTVFADSRKLRDVISFEFFKDDHHTTFEECANLCTELTVGIVVKPASYYVNEGGIPALRSLNVFPNRYTLEDLVYLSVEGHEANQKSCLKRDDVIIVRTGRPGDAAVVNEQVAGFNCIDLVIARVNGRIRPHYLMHFLNSAAGRRSLFKRTAGTAQQHLNVSALAKVKIPLKSLTEQDHIVEQFTEVDNRILQVSDHIARLQVVKRALLTDLLSVQPVKEASHV